MKLLLQTLFIAISVLFFTGCAATYKPIDPKTLNYSAHDIVDGVSVSYQYDVLTFRNNKKYAKKEIKKELRVIAVKITNNSNAPITIGKDAFFYGGDNKIVPVDPFIVKQELEQNVASYLLYALFTLLRYQKYDAFGNITESYNVGYILGPGLTLGNMLTADGANVKFRKELFEYNLDQRTIETGETVYGIVGIKHFNFSALSVRTH